MVSRTWAVIVALATSIVFTSPAYARPSRSSVEPPRIDAPVIDSAHVLSSVVKQALVERLAQHRAEGHAQIAVLVVVTTRRVPIDDYALRAAERWGGGSQAKDDGVLFVLAVQDHAMHIAVGYGVEDAIPDSRARRILDGVTPALREARFDDAIWSVVDALVTATGGTSMPVPSSAPATTDEDIANESVSNAPASAPVSTTPRAEERRAFDGTPYREPPEFEASPVTKVIFTVVGLGLLVAVISLLFVAREGVTYGSGGVDRRDRLRGRDPFWRSSTRHSSHSSRHEGWSSGSSGHHGSSSSGHHGASSHANTSYTGGGGRFGGGGASKNW